MDRCHALDPALQPGPPAVSLARRAERRRRLVSVGEADLDLAATVARQQHHRVDAEGAVDVSLVGLSRWQDGGPPDEEESREDEQEP